jgi:hypothetical protein
VALHPAGSSPLLQERGHVGVDDDVGHSLGERGAPRGM